MAEKKEEKEEEALTIQYVSPSLLKPFQYSLDLFPKLEGDAYNILKLDIKDNGIRTPLEITKENLILCGHERQRVALELGIKKVPVIYFGSNDLKAQKIRCIKDNLARKAVSFRTKIRCYKELKDLQLKSGELGKIQAVKGKKGFQPASRSSEGLAKKLTEDDVAHEIGFSTATMERAETIEDSDLPDTIKNAAFDGRLSIRPVAELAKEDPKIKKIVTAETLKRLDAGEDGFSVETLVRDTKQEVNVQQVMDAAGIPSVEKQIEGFYKKIAPAGTLVSPKNAQLKQEDIIKGINTLISANKLSCKVCGEKHVKWKCGHEFA